MPERDEVSWNVMVTGYYQSGMVEDGHIPKRDIVMWMAMVKGYAWKGRIQDTCNFFDTMPEKNVVSWTIMVTALV
jgi:hypothetical protein